MTLFLCNFASAHHYIVFKSNNQHVIDVQTFTFKSSGLTKELHSFRNYSHYCLKSKGMLMQVKEAPDTYGHDSLRAIVTFFFIILIPTMNFSISPATFHIIYRNLTTDIARIMESVVPFLTPENAFLLLFVTLYILTSL